MSNTISENTFPKAYFSSAFTRRVVVITVALVIIGALGFGLFNLLSSLNIAFSGLNTISMEVSLGLIGASLAAAIALLILNCCLSKEKTINLPSNTRNISSASHSAPQGRDNSKDLRTFTGFLPNELLSKIIQYLPVNKMHQVALVNSNCKSIVQAYRLERAQEYGYWGSDIKEANKYLAKLFKSMILFMLFEKVIPESCIVKDCYKNNYKYYCKYRFEYKNFTYNYESIIKLVQKNNDPKVKEQLNLRLQKSAKQSNREEVLALLVLGADHNTSKLRDIFDDHVDWEANVLMWASSKGYIEIVKYLIKIRADLNTQINNGYTSLIYATLNNKIDVVKCLINHGSNIDIQDNKGRTALMIAIEYESQRDFMTAETCEIARSIAQYLIDHKADLNVKNQSGNTALMIAIEYGRGEIAGSIAQYLIDREANLNVKNQEGKTALMLAIEYGHSEIARSIAQYLIDHEDDLNVKDQSGNTALMIASIFGNSEMVQYLIDHKADPNSQNNCGDTALILATKDRNFEIAKYLIDHNADFNLKNQLGKTALMLAVKYHTRSKIAGYLIDRKADVNVKNQEGKTALMLAIEYGHSEIAKYLIDHEADLNVKNQEGKTALMLAIEYGHSEIAKYLIDHGANLDLSDNMGETALILAANFNNVEITKCLLEHQIDHYAENNSRLNALFTAFFRNHMEIFNLLRGYIDLNSQRDGYTFLHRYVAVNNIIMINFLIDQNVDLNAKDEKGSTPLDWAVEYKREKAVAILTSAIQKQTQCNNS